jgi:hypothetical protein
MPAWRWAVMKIHVKKKKFQAFCRSQVAKGLVNDENGNWIPANSGKAQHSMMIAGYKLGRAK